MAEEHNALKYGPQLSKAASVVLGGGYGDVGLSRLSESLVVVADLWSQPEWALPRSEILFARFVDVPAVVARFASIELVNPIASRTLAVVTYIQSVAGAFQASIDNGTAIAANPVTEAGVALDGRWPQLGETSRLSVVSGDLAAGVVTPQWQWAAGLRDPTPTWILDPGRKLFLVCTGVTTAISANIVWRERFPFPGELQARG
jgi:hypothetical protein